MDKLPPFDKIGVEPVPDFVNASPSAGITGSIVNGEIFNALQDEVVNLIEGAGLTPDGNNYAQVLAAVRALIGASGLGVGSLWHLGTATGGTSSAYTTTLSPAIPTGSTPFFFACPISVTNTVASGITTIDFGLGPKTIVDNFSGTTNTPSAAGRIPGANAEALFFYDGTYARKIGLTPADVNALIAAAASGGSSTPQAALVAYETNGTSSWTATSTTVDVMVVGAGGSGGGSSGIAAGAGGGGGVSRKRVTGLTVGTAYTIIVGAGGAAIAAGNSTTGNTGGSSSAFSVSATAGQGGQPQGSSGSPGGLGGQGSGGDLNYAGQPGQSANGVGAGYSNYPLGGGAVGFTGGGAVPGATNSQPGPTPGAGGGGGSSSYASGAGHDGAVYIQPR